MFSTTSPAPTSDAIRVEVAAMTATPGAYPIWRLARALDGAPAGSVPSTAAIRRAVALRDNLRT